MDNKLKSFAIQTLRRASYRWYGRYNALKKASIGRNQYTCALCPPGTIHPRKGVQIDHKDPVVDPIIGWTNFDDFITRMFVSEEGFQILCLECHKSKTTSENTTRKANKVKNKLTKPRKKSKIKE